MPKPPKVQEPKALPSMPTPASYISRPTSADYAKLNRPNKFSNPAFGAAGSLVGAPSLIGGV